VVIERLEPDEWERLKAIRLRALADAPDAFGSTVEEVRVWPDTRWQEQCRTIATFVAVIDGGDVGMVRGVASTEYHDAAFLISMWVAPTARRQGVGSALVDSLTAWADAGGFSRLLLDVADTAPGAIALYASKGFVANGHRGNMPPPRVHISEHRRELRFDR
jgi:GNAT superfamily N-acetyltransferase